MIPNFDALKKQLGELAAIVNEFKSEQVQLRVVDALLVSIGISPEVQDGSDAREQVDRSAPRRRKAKKSGNKNAENTTGTAAKKGKGPKAAILELIDSGNFKNKRTAGEVQEELRVKTSRTSSLSTIQTALNRLLEDKLIQRDRDEETKQFRYWK